MVDENDNLLSGINFHPQLHKIRLIIMSDTTKTLYVSLFNNNKYIYIYKTKQYFFF
jgi:hypothetical protein